MQLYVVNLNCLHAEEGSAKTSSLSLSKCLVVKNLVFVVLSCLFIAALWSPIGETADLLPVVCVVVYCALSLSQSVLVHIRHKCYDIKPVRKEEGKSYWKIPLCDDDATREK